MTNPQTGKHPEQFKTPNDKNEVIVSRADLPIHCPLEGSALWNSHPRVYIPVEENGGQARCIYCGTVYRLAE